LPRNNRCARFGFLALFTARTSFASFTGAALPALPAHQLPIVTGADPRIVTPSDKGGTIERNNVEPLVLLALIECAGDAR
jgi:hypothetical protein